MYCPDCGAPTEYTAKKPNFCMSCGYNFLTKAKASSEPPRQPKKQNQENADPDSEEFDVKEIDPRVYDMQGLEVDISVDVPQRVTMGQMFPGAANAGNEKKKPKK